MERLLSRQTVRTVSSRSRSRPPVCPSAFQHDDAASMCMRYPVKSTSTEHFTGATLRPSTAAPLSPSQTASGHRVLHQGILLASVRARPHTGNPAAVHATSWTKICSKPLSTCESDITVAAMLKPEEAKWGARPGSRGVPIASDETEEEVQEILSSAWEEQEILKRITSKTLTAAHKSANDGTRHGALPCGVSTRQVFEKQDLLWHKHQFEQLSVKDEMWLKMQRVDRFRNKQLHLARPRTPYLTDEEVKETRGVQTAKKACFRLKKYGETKEKIAKVRDFVRGDVKQKQELRGHAAAVQAIEKDRNIYPARQQLMLKPFEGKLAEMEKEIQEHQRRLFFDGPVSEWMLPLLSTKAAGYFIIPSKPRDLPNTVAGFKNSPAGCLDFKWEDELDIIRVLGLFADLVHRCGEKVILRPCWCRWVIETGLVDPANTFDANETLRTPTYHHAIRHFDALSHPLGQPNSTQSDTPSAQTMTITEYEAVKLTGALLSLNANAEHAQKQFLEFLPKLETMITALLQRGPSVKEQAHMIEQKQFQKMVSVSRPPVGTSMPEWVQGLSQWRSKFFPEEDQPIDAEVDLDASANLKERYAEEEYLLAMTIEPEVLHWERVFRSLFVSLFALYRDFSTDHLLGLTNQMHECGHMSYGAWMRFCLDWRLVPQLATQEEAKRAYRNCVCAEHDYYDPLYVKSSVTTKATVAEKDRSAGAASRGAESPRSATSRTSPRAKKKAVSPTSPSRLLQAQAQTQKPSEKAGSPKKTTAAPSSTGAVFPIEPDHAWVRKPASGMTEDESMVFEVLSIVDKYLIDHFMTIKQFCLQCDVAKDGMLTVAHLAKLLECADVNTPQYGSEDTSGSHITTTDVSVVIKTIEGNPEACSLREFRRVQSLVHLERKRRTEGDNGASQVLNEKDRLFMQINADNEFYEPLYKSKHVFGYAAFLESVVKFALRHLTMKESFSSLHSAAPVLAKCFWLLAYLEKRYDELAGLSRHERRRNALKENQATTPRRQHDGGMSPGGALESRSTLTHEKTPKGQGPSSIEKRRDQRAVPSPEVDDASTSGGLTQHNSTGEDVSSERLRRPRSRIGYVPAKDRITRGLFAFSDTDHGKGKVCAECQSKPWSGWGSATCHRCSVVDKYPLSTSPFYPLLVPRGDKAS